MGIKTMFKEVGDYLVRHDKWKKNTSNRYIKEISRNAYAYIVYEIGDIIVGYSNRLSSFNVFSTDDDFEMELTAEHIYDIAIATQKIAELYNKMIITK